MNNGDCPNNYPSVSIIVPVYNGMSTLPELLDSIEKQDFTGQMEVIIVDDGSTDESADFSEKRGYKVIRQENKGPGIARNTGAQTATGELLVFTDADCILDTNFITELISPLLNSDIIGSQGIFYSTQDSLVARFIEREIQERYEIQSSIQYIDWIATYGACYRRDVFLENDGFSETYSSEDAEFSIRLGQKGYKMVIAPKARCKHKNYENLYQFVRYKYKRAYWTIWLYKKFPNRLIKDKLTPSSRKYLMLLLAISLISYLLGIFNSLFVYLGTVFFIIFFVFTLPFAIRSMKKDIIIGLLSPFFLFVRTMCYIFGFSFGLFDYLRGRQGVKKSAAK